MGFFVRVGQELADAFRTNWRFLSTGFDNLPNERSLIASELRELIDRDLAILVHKRNKWSTDDDGARQRWFADLEAFVSRTLRPMLAGQSVIALWNDTALVHALDLVVATEQAAVANAPGRIPVTCRFDSHWAT